MPPRWTLGRRHRGLEAEQIFHRLTDAVLHDDLGVDDVFVSRQHQGLSRDSGCPSAITSEAYFQASNGLNVHHVELLNGRRPAITESGLVVVVNDPNVRMTPTCPGCTV